jgi:electron transfer flavoprotein alpha subunit
VRRLEDAGSFLRLELEHDDGFQEVEVDLPAVLSVAERLCEPCKVDPEGRAVVPVERLTRLGAAALGPGPWGDAGSPTVVGATRVMVHERAATVLDGPVGAQVDAALALLEARGALTPRAAGPVAATDPDERPGTPGAPGSSGPIAVVVEPGRADVAGELLGAAARLARKAGAPVHALVAGDGDVGAAFGAERVLVFTGSTVAEDVADAVVDYVRTSTPWAVLAPSTAFGREVAGRAAAATGSGLVGDAVELTVRDGRLVAAKPAFSGALVADITCRSATQMATVRPGVLPPGRRAGGRPQVEARRLAARGRVRVLGERRNDDVETLARAEVVIGVGSAVAPDEYELLSPLAALLGAELAATRKVTDKGWAPRARQVGITGRAIAPRLYVAIGLSGKFNHMVGVRGAGTILAVNCDVAAPVFGFCDVGVVGDWREVVPLLADAVRARHTATRTDATIS